KVTISADDVLIRAQDTPNPNAIKFIVNYSLKDVGNATFTSPEQAASLPLVKSIFDLPGVEQVYLFQNTLTVTHTDELPSDIIKDQITAILKTRLAVHRADFMSHEESTMKPKVDRSTLSPEIQQIEDILDRTIRPGLQSDGGDVEIVEFQDNQLKIVYQGACGGCPSSMMGTLDAIQSILRNEMQNEQITVMPV
ncbi:MAG: NifU family protein, partial [Bdellovibrionota bacterium]